MAYFVRIKSRVFGPFDEPQLLEMKSKGKITRVTEVSENKYAWQAAETLTFLYEPVQTPPQTPTAWASPEPAEWFYSINGTEGYGPITATAIEQMLQSGQLSGNSYVWQQGQNARFIKSEPRFSGTGGTPMIPSSVTSTTRSDTPNIGGEITGASEQVDTGQMLRPIAASLGWLMFLKITFLLVGVILEGLCLLWIGGAWISIAIKFNEAATLFVVLMTIVIQAGLYALQFKAFLCFWKYHTNLNQTVATGRASDLIQANQSQLLFWKWLGITVIANLSVFIIIVTVMVLAPGLRDIAQNLSQGL